MADTAPPPIPFGARSTADEVLAGIDLTGRTILLTGCTTGIGFETMRALAWHGAHVMALARTEQAAQAAATKAGVAVTPIACDLGDLASVMRAVAAVRGLGRKLDAIIASAGVMGGRKAQLLHGIERQFLINHVAHFLLVTRLMDLVPDGTGRVVIVSSSASIGLAPTKGILFGNLDARRGYRALRFYGQSKLANALFARELARRVAGRGITANAVHPGVILGTQLVRNMAWPIRVAIGLAGRFSKSLAQGAATQTLVAASPLVQGITGKFWADCQVAEGSRHMDDPAMSGQLWTVTEDIIARELGEN
ncbi:MAG TPA: SDR family NAD(P)-dependent oxidoreductase [Acetobacteraceae bacterium]|jgi:WW domain-containing oxidoreductase